MDMNDTDTFAEFMEQERARIHQERDSLLADKSAIEQRLTQLSRDMQAIDAYAAAKAGKVTTPRSRRAAGTNGARPGSRRKAIAEVLNAYPQGLGRGELLELLGVKGNKSGEMAVSNALTALIKNNTLARHDGKYVLAV
jgi:uncharacterized protein